MDKSFVRRLLESNRPPEVKAAFCFRKSRECAYLYELGKQESIDYVMASRQYRHTMLDDKTKRQVGFQIWINSVKAKELIEDERFFDRWFHLYHDAAYAARDAHRVGQMTESH